MYQNGCFTYSASIFYLKGETMFFDERWEKFLVNKKAT